MKGILKEFLSSVFAGVSISLGCMIYLLVENKIIGAMFFAVGLFLVLTRKYHLFTGKVANLVEEKPKYIGNLCVIWLGNLVGSSIWAVLTSLTRLNTLSATAQTVVTNKLSQGYLSAFIMAIFCGIIIYLSVDNFNKNENFIGKYFGLIILIPLFIICGFEHCIANMYYILLSGNISVDMLIFTVVVTLGNSVGSIVYKFVEKLKN